MWDWARAGGDRDIDVAVRPRLASGFAAVQIGRGHARNQGLDVWRAEAKRMAANLTQPDQHDH